MKRQAFSLCKLSTVRIQALRQAPGGFIAARRASKIVNWHSSCSTMAMADSVTGHFLQVRIPARSFPRATAGGSLLRQHGRLSDGAPLWFHEVSSWPGRAGPQPPENPLSTPAGRQRTARPMACSAEQAQSQTTRKIRQIKPCHRKAPLRSLNHGSSELGTRYGNVT